MSRPGYRAKVLGTIDIWMSRAMRSSLSILSLMVVASSSWSYATLSSWWAFFSFLSAL